MNVKAYVPIVNLKSFEFVEKSSLEGEFEQTAASDTKFNIQNPQIEVNPSVNYILINSDEDSKEFEEFEEKPNMQDISGDSEDLPSEH